MFRIILQNTAAVLISLFVAILLLAGIEWVGAILHPFPADFAGTREEVMEQVANYPAWILALLGGAGWGFTMFTATWIATRCSAKRHPVYGVGIGVVLLSAAVFNMAMLPYPLWYWILELLVLPTGIYLGTLIGANKTDSSIL
ncbi:MAG: hypothetical protein MI746_09400 [Pseudomonadales bacterium]|nr:hypothetical protein [Pseudomonadales bacterium]